VARRRDKGSGTSEGDWFSQRQSGALVRRQCGVAARRPGRKAARLRGSTQHDGTAGRRQCGLLARSSGIMARRHSSSGRISSGSISSGSSGVVTRREDGTLSTAKKQCVQHVFSAVAKTQCRAVRCSLLMF
jgi:hypothetical protein